MDISEDSEPGLSKFDVVLSFTLEVSWYRLHKVIVNMNQAKA